MRNKCSIVVAIVLLSICTSCKNPLLTDSRMYNKNPNKVNNESNSQNNAPNIDLEDDEASGVVNPFDIADSWFNDPTCNGDEDNQDKKGFDAKEFETMALTSWFNKQNVPQYEMSAQDVWKIVDNNTKQFLYKGPNTKSKAGDKNSGFDVTNVRYYNNRGYNPLYDEKTNTSLATTKAGAPRLSRFYFFSFKGDCMGQKLDNYLIAIDTYSKFIFAFAKPTGFKSVMGNQVPTGWGMVDESNLFYEYDPVGYVEKTDNSNYNVIMYPWFVENLSKNNYKANINSSFSTIAKKNPSGAGKSPFKKTKAEGFFNNVMGQSFSYRDENGDGLNKITYAFSDNGKSVIITTTPWGGTPIVETGTVTESQNGKLNGTIKVSGKKDIDLVLNEDNSMLINGQKAFVNFKDLGPTFKNRVRTQPIFETEDKNHSYLFKEEEGLSKLVIDNKTTYGFDCVQPERNRAIYSRKQGISWYLIGIELSNNGKNIKKTDEKLKFITSAVDWSTLGTQAKLVDKITGKEFTSIVANQTYEFRELAGYEGKDGQGYGLNLYTYKFSPDGKVLTFITTPWIKEPTTIECDVKIDPNNKITATVNINGIKVDLSLNESATILKIGEDFAYLDFKDIGPSFENRLLGVRDFFIGNKSASLSGGTNNIDILTWKEPGLFGKQKTYTYNKCNPESGDSRNYMIYKNESGTLFYKLEVTGKTKETVSIRMSKGGRPWASVRDDTKMTDWLKSK